MATALPSTSGESETWGLGKKTVEEPKTKPEGEQKKTRRVFRVLVTGCSRTGKTAFVNRYVSDEFHHYVPTDGFHLFTKEIEREACSITLNIIDVGGSAGPDILRAPCFEKCTGAILTYDRTQQWRFSLLIYWIRAIQQLKLPDGRPIPLILAITKCDLGGILEMTEWLLKESYCRDNGILDFAKTSAKTNTMVHASFNYLIHAMLKWTPILYSIPDARVDPSVIHCEEIKKSDMKILHWYKKRK